MRRFVIEDQMDYQKDQNRKLHENKRKSFDSNWSWIACYSKQLEYEGKDLSINQKFHHQTISSFQDLKHQTSN